MVSSLWMRRAIKSKPTNGCDPTKRFQFSLKSSDEKNQNIKYNSNDYEISWPPKDSWK